MIFETMILLCYSVETLNYFNWSWWTIPALIMIFDLWKGRLSGCYNYSLHLSDFEAPMISISVLNIGIWSTGSLLPLKVDCEGGLKILRTGTFQISAERVGDPIPPSPHRYGGARPVVVGSCWLKLVGLRFIVAASVTEFASLQRCLDWHLPQPPILSRALLLWEYWWWPRIVLPKPHSGH